MVYFRLVLSLILIQLASLNVSRLFVNASIWSPWSRGRIKNQDIPTKTKHNKADVKNFSSVKSYVKYTFTPNQTHVFSHNGKRITRTDKYGKTFKPLTAEGITEASVYYWNHKNGTRPILLELKHSKGSTYYRNLEQGNDEKWQDETVTDDDDLEDVLDYGNCYLNKGFSANITFTTRKTPNNGMSFCLRCQSKSNFLEESVKTQESGEIMYNYLFKVESGYTLTDIRYEDSVTNKRKRVSIPGLQLPSTTLLTLRLYYCNHNPALIYIEESNKSNKWYKRDGDNWVYLKELDNKTPSSAKECETRRSYTTMLQNLGCSFRPGTCTANPLTRVAVDISQNPETRSYVPNASDVEVTVSEPTDFDDFQKITHLTKQKTFTLSTVHHGTTVINIPATNRVKELNVYYWKFDEDYAGPLLVNIVKKKGTTRGDTEETEWYENTGHGRTKNARWRKVEDSSKLSRKQDLIDKLKVVNCRINHAYTFDLSKEQNYTSFCLNVKVEITNDIVNDLGYTKYAHNTDVVPFTLLGLTKLPDTNMGLPDLTDQPLHNVSGVYVFKPRVQGEPPLVYLEMADKVHSGWYGNVSEKEEGTTDREL